MSTLIMWHNRFCENRNNAVEVHIPRHSKPKSHDVEILRPKNRNIEIWGLKHGGIKKRRQLSHGIVIPRHFFSRQKARSSRFQAQKTTTWSFYGILTLMLPDILTR